MVATSGGQCSRGRRGKARGRAVLPGSTLSHFWPWRVPPAPPPTHFTPARLGRPARHVPCVNHPPGGFRWGSSQRTEEHTSELQSQCHLVCRLLLEKKKKKISTCGLPQKRSQKICSSQNTV